LAERQEGKDAGDGVRLRGRNKALKGEPHERIRPEIRLAGTGRHKAPGGRENLEAQALAGASRRQYAAALCGDTL
jgi:hypothetical protein